MSLPSSVPVIYKSSSLFEKDELLGIHSVVAPSPVRQWQNEGLGVDRPRYLRKQDFLACAK